MCYWFKFDVKVTSLKNEKSYSDTKIECVLKKNKTNSNFGSKWIVVICF
jgi:hypothetical protein